MSMQARYSTTQNPSKAAQSPLLWATGPAGWESTDMTTWGQ